MTANAPRSVYERKLGRHTKLAVRADFTIGGQQVELDGFTAQAWVRPAGAEAATQKAATIDGNHAVYQMTDDDLADASGTGEQGRCEITIVVDDGEGTRLVSDPRAIPVGDWHGADKFTA